MAVHVFTKEAIAELAANPYVIKVTKHNIYFSGEFKQLYFKKMCNGVSDEDFFNGIGIDPALLGERRISGLKSNIRQTIREGKKLEDPVLKGGPPSLQADVNKTINVVKTRHQLYKALHTGYSPPHRRQYCRIPAKTTR